jgi:NitT/TauT family transport system permease protein/taurine transport system permease protein
LNQGAVTFIIFMSAFFPILFSTLTGVRATDRVLIDASETLGATHRDIVRHVILPSTLPFVMTGVRLGFGYGFRALVAGEMIAGSSGLGYMIFNAQDYLRSDIVVLGMLVIGILWLLIDRIVLKPIERRTVERWGTLAAS